MTGNVIAQLIPVLASPVLTRIFNPTEFGLLGLFMVITNSFSVIGSARYEMAILIPEKEEEGKNVFALSVLIALITGIVFGGITFFFHDLIIEKLNRPDFSTLLYLAPVVILFISVYQALNFWLIRKKEFRKNAANKIGQTFASTFGSVTLGLLGVKYGIVLGYALGWLAINIVGWFQLRSTSFSISGISSAGIKKVFNRYSDFLTFNTFPSLLNAISSGLPTFFINLFYTTNIAGYFTLARQVLVVPVSFISYAMSQVFFQRASQNIQKNISIKAEFRNLFMLLGILGLAMFLVVATLGPFLFSFVFGSKWETAGEYARILALSCSIQFVVSSFSILLPALQRIKLISVWQVLYFISICSLYYFGSRDIHTFLYSYLAVDTMLYSLYFVFILAAVNKYEKNSRPNDLQVV